MTSELILAKAVACAIYAAVFWASLQGVTLTIDWAIATYKNWGRA